MKKPLLSGSGFRCDEFFDRSLERCRIPIEGDYVAVVKRVREYPGALSSLEDDPPIVIGAARDRARAAVKNVFAGFADWYNAVI
jgi:hypothetical protein